MKVIIMTEGGERIGIGHITRCLSLYQAFESRGITPELIVNADETIKDILKGKNSRIFNWLERETNLLNDVIRTDIAIIDSYLAGIEFYMNISRAAGVCAYIDDNVRLDYPDGFVINGVIAAEGLNYKKRKGAVYLLGTRYMPLRKEFWETTGKKIREDIENIIITFGGNDDKGITPRVLKFLNEAYPHLYKKVVIGRYFKNIKEIEDLKNERTQLVYYPDAKTMREMMIEADAAVSAGGQTLYELARIGVPTVAIAVADNQLNNIKGGRESGFIEYAGWWADADIMRNLGEGMKVLMPMETRMRMCAAGRENVNGCGAANIVTELLQGARVAA